MNNEYVKINVPVHKMSDFEVKAGINNVLSSSDLIKRMNELIINDAYEKNIRELINRIARAIEYIENNPLYEKEYDYDYDDNLELSNISDSEAKEELLNILRGEENE